MYVYYYYHLFFSLILFVFGRGKYNTVVVVRFSSVTFFQFLNAFLHFFFFF